MPFYLFEHIDTGEVREIFFHMDDFKEYNGEDGKESDKWRRVWLKPQAAFDTKVDIYSAKDFVKATNKKGTIGDLQDRSAELSEKRKEKDGKDPIKEKFYKDYAAKRKGKKHQFQRQEEVKEKFKSVAKIEF